jgi:8-oxo-dGTP pyrophosphatase MutT (NUDIX family)
MPQSLPKSIQSYSHQFPQESSTTADFLNFLTSGEDCFSRSNLTRHITASAWIINQEDHTHALLCHHRKLNRWLQLGGHCDGCEDTLAVATKEAEEESGLPNVIPITVAILDLDIHPIPARGEVPEHLHYDVRYLMSAPMSAQLTLSDESIALAWIPINQITINTYGTSVARMAEKAMGRGLQSANPVRAPLSSN